MAISTPVTELDFDQIKADIISYFKSDPTYSDYNFEGSALNTIINMLAYNTHTNAYYANMLHNEGFLDTAQKRSSVVSRAKELGYVPKSVSGSMAVMDITVSGVTEPIIYLPRGSIFTSSNDNGNYTFVTKEDYTSITSGSDKVWKDVVLVEGRMGSNYFKVDTTSNLRSIFTIPSKNVDISTLKVFVRNSGTATGSIEYIRTTSAYDLTPTSKVFFIQESYDGFFQFYFGQDVIGNQPTNGNIIDISYVISDNMTLANGCTSFVSSTNYGSSIAYTVSQVSFGGSDRETIQSIKNNAVQSYTTKHLAVTDSNYQSVLKENFNFIKSVSVWGGENNVPPVYGKVFISMQPTSGYTISDAVKNNLISPLLKKYSVRTIGHVFVDPAYTNLNFTTKLKFNPNNSNNSKFGVETLVKSKIISYVNSISEFGMDYLESELLNQISTIDTGISSVSISKTVGFRLTPLLNTEVRHQKNINNKIVRGTITSSKFNIYINGSITTVKIKEIPNTDTNYTTSTGTVNVLSGIGLYTISGTLLRDIGTVNLDTGVFDITFSLYSYLTGNRFIDVKFYLELDDIIVTQNQILTMFTDIEDAAIDVPSNNIIDTIIYGK